MLFNNKDIFKIIFPILIEQILAITIGMLDSVMVSVVGENAVSGVSLVSSINVLFINFFTAMATGGAIVIAQLLGRKDESEAKESAKQLLYLVTVLATVVGVLCFVFRAEILNLVFGKVEFDVMQSALTYFFYTTLCYPLIGIRNSCAAICRAQGETKMPMIFSVICNFINLGGNATLIYGFNMGVAGASIATLISHVVATVFLLSYVLTSKKLVVKIEKLFKYKFSGSLIKRICAIGIPNGFENSVFQIGRVLLTSLVSGFGTASIAANAVANSLCNFQYAQGNAVGSGVTAIVGKCVGAGELKQAKQNTKKLVGIAYVGMYVVSIILCVFSSFFIGLYNLEPQSTELCTNLIFMHSIMVCLMWPIAFVLPQAFRSASDVNFTTAISMIAMWVFRVGLSFVLAYAFNFGVYSVWISMFLDWVFRIIFFIPRFVKGTWLKKFTT